MGLDTLANVKSRLGIAGSTDDTFLQAQINLVSDAIERYCCRKFAVGNYVQTFYNEDYDPSRQIMLAAYPLISVASIVEDTMPTSSPPALDPSFYRVNLAAGIISANRWMSKTFFYPFNYQTVVTYQAGYATIPSPVLCVLDAVVQERYNKKKNSVGLDFGSDVQSITIPGSIAIQFDFSLKQNQRNSPYGVILGVHANLLDDWATERQIIGSGRLEYVVVT